MLPPMLLPAFLGWSALCAILNLIEAHLRRSRGWTRPIGATFQHSTSNTLLGLLCAALVVAEVGRSAWAVLHGGVPCGAAQEWVLCLLAGALATEILVVVWADGLRQRRGLLGRGLALGALLGVLIQGQGAGGALILASLVLLEPERHLLPLLRSVGQQAPRVAWISAGLSALLWGGLLPLAALGVVWGQLGGG